MKLKKLNDKNTHKYYSKKKKIENSQNCSQRVSTVDKTEWIIWKSFEKLDYFENTLGIININI